MRKYLLWSGLCLLPFFTIAQISISAQLPAGGYVQKEQLWNLILMNNNEMIPDVTIQLSLADATTGQEIINAQSGVFVLNKGIKILNLREIQPVIYNHNAGVSSNALPMGSYIICYRVIRFSGKQDPIASECLRLNIDPLSPPLLNTPSDISELITPYPHFTWIPPAPFDMFTKLSYELLLAEVFPGQNPTDAIEFNNPVFAVNNLTQPFLNYGSSFSKLDTGKFYAWRVTAKNDLNYAAKTEVWSFKIKNPEKPFTADNSYILLNHSGSNEIFNLTGKEINIKHYSYQKTDGAQIQFFSPSSRLIQENKTQLIYGDNFLNVRLSNKFKKGILYKIQLTTDSGKTHSALFSLSNEKP